MPWSGSVHGPRTELCTRGRPPETTHCHDRSRSITTHHLGAGARHGLRGLLREGEAPAEPEATGYSSEIEYFAGSRLGRSLALPCRLQTMSCTPSALREVVRRWEPGYNRVRSPMFEMCRGCSTRAVPPPQLTCRVRETHLSPRTVRFTHPTSVDPWETTH